MARTTTFWRAAAIAVLIGVVELGGATALTVGLSDPAAAQFFRERRGGGGGFFESLFGPRRYGPVERNAPVRQPQPAESSRAPAPKKSDTTPTLTVMVMGDSMADWLGFGLEEAFADSPEIGIVREAKTHSGLIRYEARSDLDWWHVARDLLAKQKVDYVVMMLGVNDRTSIRESQVEKKEAQEASEEAAKEENEADEKPGDEAKTDKKADKKDDDAAPERKRRSSSVIEFRTERWEQIYTKRIDETIAALKSRGVPVLWVGLPSIRGTRSTADTVYLNDLFRARAERAGIVFVDVWDGFVDENGKFTYAGPDFEGQNRRLRSGDGVHFTKNGARKLAHYVERELRRFMSNRALPLAMPSGPELQSVPGEPAARPVAGPVLPLTGVTASTDELLGGGGVRPVHSDPVATRVLVKGEPVAPPDGRADNFKWPRPEAANAEPLPPVAAAARAAPIAPPKAAPKPGAKDAKQVAREPAKDAGKREPVASARPARPAATAADQSPPRPRAPVQQRTQSPSSGLFGLFR